MLVASLWLAMVGFAPGSSLSVNLASHPTRWQATIRSARSAPCMEMQELEFIIHPDGRVEERVRGIKGQNCQEVTAKIEEAAEKMTALTAELGKIMGDMQGGAAPAEE